MIERIFTVEAPLGLHARAAAKLVRVANQFQSNQRLERADGSATADAKSILSVLMLAASMGTELRLVAEGHDELEAVTALETLFLAGFEETAEPAIRNFVEPQERRWKGLGVSEGLVIGRVLRIHDETRYVYREHVAETELEKELRRFRAAVRLARRQLQAIKERAEKQLGKDHAYIFDAHLLFLEDEKLTNDVENLIRQEQTNAEWALKVIGDRLLSVYSEMKDDYLRERGSDIEDVVQRLLVTLSGERASHRQLSEDAVIVSQDLLPSAVAELDLEHARAVVTDTGGWTSHTAIIARGLGIPAVVGLRNFYLFARTGDNVIVDSQNGEVILHPAAATMEHYQRELALRTNERGVESSNERAPAITSDGREIRLWANVELPSEFGGVRRFGAWGVGLYRSEFLLARRGMMVSEDEQYTAYLEVAALGGEGGVVVRLFDLGGDKQLDTGGERERNPALGLRAIRYGLRHQEMMRTQIRAILRAAAMARVDVVFPMVSGVADVKRGKRIIEEEKASLQSQGIASGEVRIGAMIEIPSAVLIADRIASIVDFLELGTNDLVQYTLAVDRSNEAVSDWYRTLHPAVLFGIQRSLEAAQKAGIPAIVCGEMASTPAYAVLLAGLGATDLSMTPVLIPRVRRALSAIDVAVAESIVRDCLDCDTADDVEDLVRQRFRAHWPDAFSLRNLPAMRPE